MPNDSMMESLRLDDHEIRNRRAFFEIEDADLERLARLKPLAIAHGEAVVDEFYRLLLGHAGTRAFLTDDVVLRRLKVLQKQYFLGLFDGVLNEAYVANRIRVGAAHERIGLEPKWYIGAYARYQRQMHGLIFDALEPSEAAAGFCSMQKLVSFDMALAIDTYIRANLDTIQRHQAAIRELSTPVIRVYDRVLLMPIVGTIDSHRAHQIMETVLVRVTEDQARVLILDIAGVGIVDTKVADHLLKTTAAVRLLGAETILTGISAQVARTIVQLGVDISAMHTRSRLADGIALALATVGREIRETRDARDTGPRHP